MMSEDNLLRGANAEGMELVEKLRMYLSQICGPMLLDEASSTSALQDALSTSESIDAIVRFATSSECSVLHAERLESGVVRFGLDVRMPANSAVVAGLAVIKAREAPIDSAKSLSSQIQVISMSLDGDGELGSEESSQAFFSRLHQVTKHYYAPLARSARTFSHVRFRPSM